MADNLALNRSLGIFMSKAGSHVAVDSLHIFPLTGLIFASDQF